MADSFSVGGINHLTLTVSDVERSKAFYTDVLNFQVAMVLSPERIILSNGNVLLVVSEPWDKSRPTQPNDHFDENRIGLDHVSFNVADKAALEEAARVLDARGISHGTINDLSGYGLPMWVMSFRDPDNIQLEISAPG